MKIHLFWTQHPPKKNPKAIKQCANSELAWHVYAWSSKRWPEIEIIYRDHNTKNFEHSPGDICLGHFGNWGRFCRASRMYAFAPWPNTTCGLGSDHYKNWYFKENAPMRFECLEKARHIIAIGGAYNFSESLSDPVLGPLARKATRVHMAVDPNMYGRIKTLAGFHDPRREFCYTSCSHNTGKGWDAMVEGSVKARVRLLANGGDNQPDRYTGMSWLDPINHEQWKSIADRTDIFVLASRCDCQATATLEASCYGFMPVVTRETGFEAPAALYMDSTEESVSAALTRAAEMSVEEIRWRAEECRNYVIRHNSWGMFARKLTEVFDREEI